MARSSSEEEEERLLLPPLLVYDTTLPENCGAYTGDGSIDIRGNPALKHQTGNWRACYSIIGTELCASLTHTGVATNLVTYLRDVRHQRNIEAARNVATWQGTCFLTPLLAAFLADSYWGRYRTITISLELYATGMIMLTLSTSVQSLNLSPFLHEEFMFFLGLYLIALGFGGSKPCVSTFGADQFDDTDAVESTEKGYYFNWYYFFLNVGGFLSSTIIVWIQDRYGWTLGFSVPTLFIVVGFGYFVAGSKVYRCQKPGGSAFTRVCQVVVAAVRKMNMEVPNDSAHFYELPGNTSAIGGSRKLKHTAGLEFFDKAAIVPASEMTSSSLLSPWKLCTVTQVEELKILVRMLPILATATFFSSISVASTLFIEQGTAMDNHIGHSFSIPPASQTSFSHVTILILVPAYSKVVIPIARAFTGKKRGLSELQRIGIGLFLSVLAVASAALVETARLEIARSKGLVHRKVAVPISILWQVPQYLLLGAGQVFCIVGLIEFSYEQSPDATRSLCSALGLATATLGSYLLSVILTVVAAVTGRGGRPGWIPENLNEGHLDRFFWLMAAVGFLNMLAFVHCASRYRRKRLS